MPDTLRTVTQTITHTISDVRHSNYEKWIDIGIPIIVALLAIAGAYLIFVVETKAAKRKEDASKAVERREKLFYYTMILKRAVEVAKQQKEYVQNFVDNINNDSLTFPELQYIPLNQIKKVAELQDEELLMLSYVKFFGEAEKSVKEFDEMNSSIEYLQESFSAIKNQIHLAQTFDHERRIKIKELYKEGSKMITPVFQFFSSHYPPMNDTINEILKTHVEANKNGLYTILQIHDNFMLPLFNSLTTYILDPKKPQYSYIYELIEVLREGLQVFDDIKNQNLHVASQINGDVINIEESISNVTNFSGNLMKTFVAKT